MQEVPRWVSAHALLIVGCLFFTIAVLEAHASRDQVAGVVARWLTNFSLYATAITLMSMLPKIGVAEFIPAWDGWLVAALGPFVGTAVAFTFGFLLLDMLSYLLHRMQHFSPFWRLHHVHHADHQLDASTGLRHHPGEMAVNASIGAAITLLLGMPLWVPPVYGLAAELASLFQHSSLKLPWRIEKPLSSLVMTPGAHRVHHSDVPEHYGTNYGALLTVWDRLFGTWHAQVEGPLRFGVAGVGEQGLLRALASPVLLRPVVSGNQPSASHRSVDLRLLDGRSDEPSGVHT